ncbi:MAG: Crp/Fnr family transcriptional regulator [Planctomycetota bacterium]|jgi:CRP-like cAMP-binding protein
MKRKDFTAIPPENLVETILTQTLVDNDRALAEALTQQATLKKFMSGRMLIEQGDQSSDLYLILSGAVDIVVHGDIVAHRVAGEHFGDMAMVDPHTPRSASVYAQEETTVAIIAEPDFSTLAEEYPILWRTIARELCALIRWFNERTDHAA